MTAEKEMFQALHPDPSKQGARVTRRYYDAYREALLRVIPQSDEGIAFMELSRAAEVHVPDEIISETSPGWWTTTVKLDLEARGEIERIKIKGKQHVRRKS